MFGALLLLVLAAIAAPAVTRWLGRRAGLVLALGPGVALAYFLARLPEVVEGGVVTASVVWMESLDVGLNLRLDGLSLAFCLLISAMGVATMIYAAAYIGDDPRLGRLQCTLLLFTTAMLGVVLADDAIALFVAWELTSVTSFLLIGYDHHKGAARRAALQALLVTGGGGLALLAGLCLAGFDQGTFQISVWNSSVDRLADSPLYMRVLVLVLLGAFTKSAQFPFHFWLPGAMAAPTPISAFLHSATMVKAGVYLLARLSPSLGGTPAWETTLSIVGGFTMAMGAVIAFGRNDLKQILAYTTVSALGGLVMLLGFSTELGATAMIAYLVVHALYKGPLFHVAGIVDHETGTRELSRLGGLGRSMPITAAIAALAALSMAGVPPLLGSIAKHAMHAAEVEAPVQHALIEVLAFATNAATAAVAIMFAGLVFWRSPRETPKLPHEAPAGLWGGAAALVVASVVLALASAATFEPLIQSGATAILGVAPHAAEHGEHGGGLGLKLAAWALGAVLVWRREEILRALPEFDRLGSFGPSAVFTRSIELLRETAYIATRVLQNGYLRSYVFTVLLTSVVLAGYPLFVDRAPLPPPGALDVKLHEVVIMISMLFAAWFCARTESRLAAVVTLGVIGIGVALHFMILGGPDLAMTQLSIETLSVILFVYVLHRLPRFAHFTTAAERRRDLVLSLVVGAFFTAILWSLAAHGGGSLLSPYFAEQSLPEGKGRNVVNVILVDFRGLDTMGEVTVLAVAAMGVYGLMRLRPVGATGGTR
ncbi:MAG: hydrogen gas-evolving membrane-bound hydrogenase subunit E [Planctomycetota bacterium]|jgi:multicomponent Na+:H+ antiporter subunit A